MSSFQSTIIERWRNFKLFDKNLIVYWFLLILLILIFRDNLRDWIFPVALHLVLIGLMFVVLPWLDGMRHPVWRFIRSWYIVMALPFLYSDVGPLLHLIHSGEFDPVILSIDKFLFGELPNIWVQQFVRPVLTEIMQISYAIYWITIPLGGAIFYFSRQERLYEQLLHYVTFTFFFSYMIFVLFPVAGPRFYLADQIHASYKALFFGNYLRHFVGEVAFRGGAFPSSHVGVAVVILVFMWRFRRKLAVLVFLPMVVALSLATVYGQYHYFTDVVAGLLMGLAIGLWGTRRTAILLNIPPDASAQNVREPVSPING